tara:strand:- start:9326 stop:10987 length:1662 start_codon:yes stop_codon:yes gene_type:complete
MTKSTTLRFFLACLTLVIIQIIASNNSLRWDLTSDKRYSLSNTTIDYLDSINQPIRIDVFLNGKLPQEYQRLRAETEILLQSITAQNDRLYFEFINPYQGAENSEQLISEMTGYGLFPELVIEREDQAIEQSYVFPWMLLNLGNKTVRVSLLQKNLGDTPEQRILQSIQQLEYVVMDGIYKILLEEKKKIAILSSHGTSKNILVTDFLQDLQPYYNLAAFDLKSFPEQPEKTLENLNRFDLLLVSNPKEIFSNTEKFILDQYTQQGGNSLYLVDPVIIETDSLYSKYGKTVSYENSLDLDDLFFKFGLRLRKEIVKDLFNAPIVLAKGDQNNSQYIPYPWPYNPLSKPNQQHPIGSAVGSVLFQFGSPIDTLKNNITKTILIESSSHSKIEGIPSVISLSNSTKSINPSSFKVSEQPLGILLEGVFNSLYANRIKPFSFSATTPKYARIAIFADGNLIENQVRKGKPLELGYDKWTNNFYSNKQFFQNTVHYLIDNNQLLNLRSKKIKIAMLDKELIRVNGLFWRYFSIISPLIILLLLGFILNDYRNKSYTE